MVMHLCSVPKAFVHVCVVEAGVGSSVFQPEGKGSRASRGKQLPCGLRLRCCHVTSSHPIDASRITGPQGPTREAGMRSHLN